MKWGATVSESFAESTHITPATEIATNVGDTPASSWPPTVDLLHSALFPDYEILGLIGRGGMGVVYRARQLCLGRDVALKVLRSGLHAGPEERLRFRIEVESVAQLCHPNIVQVHEVGEQDGFPFCALEYVEGGSLAEKLAAAPLSAKEAARLMEKIARAIQAAHERGIIHRDLKPGNILLTASGQPKVTDFGLAKRIGDTDDCTRTGISMGTPSYMAPEQVESAKNVGPAADIYGLGAILYEVLTSHPPFEGDSALRIMARVVSEEPVAPRNLNVSVPRDMEIICLKCLEKDPRRRYASAEALADDLLRFMRGEPIAARPPGILERLDRWARLRPALAAMLLILIVFYSTHLILVAMGLEGEGGAYHRFVTGATPLWALATIVFQHWFSKSRRKNVLFAWTAFDALMLTLVIQQGKGAQSVMIVGYLLLIAGTGLRLRVKLIWFVTALSLLGYLFILLYDYWYHPELMVPLRQCLITALSMAALGLIQHILLRRTRHGTSDAG